MLADFCLWVYRFETFRGVFIHPLTALVQGKLQKKQVVSLTQATTIILLVENRVGSKVAIGRNWHYTRTIYFQTCQLFFGFVPCCKGLHPSTTSRTTYFPQEVRFTVEMPPAPQPRSSQDQEVKSYFQQIFTLVLTGCAYFSNKYSTIRISRL